MFVTRKDSEFDVFFHIISIVETEAKGLYYFCVSGTVDIRPLIVTITIVKYNVKFDVEYNYEGTMQIFVKRK